MNFKDYMLNVYRPMQQQARAKGMNPDDVNVGQSIQQNLAPGFLAEAQSVARKDQLGLAGRGLDLGSRALDVEQNAFNKQKRLAPWATGIGVANLGLSGVQGYAASQRAQQDRELMQKYMDEMIQLRKSGYQNP